ncbi:MAG TPA: hypothetical protein VFO93_17600 [Hymenobacter sp.]|uniref:hypothetical protein n=1 Tax=Hymenobacter sp. TaxID=1898978 RepID=UPI002D7F8B6D|nr:hypothetical protein [Hymenobacter sp.]HET9505363.1 hypothetical protein [Hymenobacter sp.]
MNVSFLLGAGFSKPAGYPLAFEVSNLLLRVQASGIATHTDGQAWLRPEFVDHLHSANAAAPFEDPRDGFSWPERAGADALEAVLEVYSQDHDLSNYEDFYDELVQYRRRDPTRLTAPAFQTAYEKRNLHADPQQEGERHIDQALVGAHNIFVQLLEGAIKRDPSAGTPVAGAAYGRLVQLLRTHGQPSRHWFNESASRHQFYLHTLNHDVFLEGLLNDEAYYSAVDYSDGFSEMGSPYYGRLELTSDFPRQFRQWPPYAHVRIPQYTGQYEGPIHLLKLHGSLDYWSFGVEANDQGLYEPQVVKKQPWLDYLRLNREVERDGKLIYRNDFTNYYSLFLTGTTAKLEQYDDPILFQRLLTRFAQNLAQSDLLVIIGYGFRDSGINEYILPFLQNQTKRVIVIGRDLPAWFPAVQPDMFRTGGLEGYDFAELEALLTAEIP